MTRPVYTIYANHPRLHVRDTDLSTIQARKDSTSSWKTEWDTLFLPAMDSLEQETASEIGSSIPLEESFLGLGLAGWVLTQTKYHDALLIGADWLADNKEASPSATRRREVLLALAYAYTFLRSGVITFADADRKKIGDAIIQYANQTSISDGSLYYLAGQPRTNFSVQAAAVLAIIDESGTGFDYTTSGRLVFDTSLDYLYGQNPGDDAALEMERWFGNDGGYPKGPWYTGRSQWSIFELFSCLNSALATLTLDGEPYDPWMDEQWIQDLPQWWCRGFWRGDKDWMARGDTFRPAAPLFERFSKRSILPQIVHSAWRKQARWLRDEWTALEAPSPATYSREIITWDPADAANANERPDLNPSFGKSRLFERAGVLHYETSFDPTQQVKYVVECAEFAPLNHNHLNCGAIQIWFRDDPLLAAPSGIFDTSDFSVDFGGVHHRNWLQQSAASSGVVLVRKSGEVHKSRNINGSLQDYTLEGGQPWKQFDPGSGLRYNPDFPKTMAQMRNDFGGLAWRRSGINSIGVNRLTLIDSVPGQYQFYHADYTFSYLKDSTFENGPEQYVKLAELKLVIIENVAPFPVLFRLVQIDTGTLSTLEKVDHWHFFTQPSVNTINPGSDQETIRIEAAGRLSKGKLTIDHYNGQKFTPTVIGGGSKSSFGYSLDYYRPAPSRPSWPPNAPTDTRDLDDVASWKVELAPTVKRGVDLFAQVFFPQGINEVPPEYDWVEEPGFRGVDFSGTRYRLAKGFIGLFPGLDTTPPDPPSGVAAISGPSSGEITVSWSPNPESDLKQYRVFRRTKA